MRISRPSCPVPSLLKHVPVVYRALSVALLGFSVLTTSDACHSRSTAPKTVAPLPAGEAERILEELDDQARTVVRYQAVLKARGKGPEGRFNATQTIVFERPDRVRVELLGAFGSTRWVAVASEGEILVWFPGRREFLRETRVERVVGTLLGVELTAREVIAALSGSGIPLGDEGPSSAVRENGVTRIEIGGVMVALEGSQVKTARRADYRVTYPTSWKTAGRPVPDRLEIANEKLMATLSVEDLDVNVRLHPEAFLVELPEGAQQLELAQIGGEAFFVKSNR